ncbi:cancer-associated gene 1 protein isoform X4 [Equus przewalskii]|uniref:Cancer-associated gene 1 protein isoform X4 n=1 Tax=Equus przewalskii TaxID=9798 RepID=A0ABM4LI34_EQUPR
MDPGHRNKDCQKVWGSPSDPVHFELEASPEKLESMSEADAMNFSSFSQGFTHSSSPFFMETSSTTSDWPQNEIKNVKRENESKFTLSEEIYSTLDDLLGDVHIGNYSQNVPTQPIDTSISSFRQFEPTCKLHQTEAFNNEMITFQNLTEGLPYTEKPELQSQVYNYAKDTNRKEGPFKEENPKGTSTSTNKEQLAHECVRQPPRSPPPIHCNGETLKFTEMSLAESTPAESALNTGQPQSFLCKENVHSDVEKPFYKENNFNLLDLRASYKTEELAFSSKGIQNSGDIPKASASHQQAVTVEGVDSPGVASPGSPAGASSSDGASQEDCRTPDTEQSLESLQPLEEDLALNEVLRKLKHTNKKQQTLIQDLQCSKMYLERKVEELQMNTSKQQVFVDIINKLKEKVEELIEEKYRVMLEKNDMDKTLQNLHEILANTQTLLQESRNEKETLQLELKKMKGNYVRLQERYMTEMQQKNKTLSQCVEMDKTLSQKAEEVERLQLLKGELKKATTCALDLLKREKVAREQEFLSLHEEFQKHEKKNLEERQKLKSSLEKLVVQVKNLQFISESEKAENIKLQQQIDEVKNENAKLQHQVARTEEQSYPKSAIAQLKEHLGDVMESDITKDAKIIHSNLVLNRSPCEDESLNPPDVKITSQLASKIRNLLALVVGLLTCQLLKHKDRITTFRELIANEKAFQDQVIEVTDFDSNEAKKVRDVPLLLGAKLDKYHNLNEELDFLIAKLGNLLESKEDHCNRLIEENDKYQRHVGNLLNKVISYEEIIECADQRLEISHSQIAHLEERNKHLEDLVRRPREKARKPRLRRLENHPKSMTVMPEILERNRNDSD